MESIRDLCRRLAAETQQEMAMIRSRLHSHTSPGEAQRLSELLVFGQQCLDEYRQDLDRTTPETGRER